MNFKDQEREVKFYLKNRAGLEARILEAGAVMVRERTHELNLRFDTPFKRLSRTHRLLRLRKDHSTFLTYKGPSKVSNGVVSRQEIEIEVGDFTAAKRLIEALGFRVMVIYEKFRTTYSIDGLEIVVDELPFGDFTEIEGKTAEEIIGLASRLNLEMSCAVQNNYLGLFNQLKRSGGYRFRDLIFENFSGDEVSGDQLGVHPAD